MQVTVHYAKTNLSRLLAQVEAGEDFVIARGSTPVATLTAFRPVIEQERGARRKPGRLKGLVAIDDRFFEPLPEEELRLWEGEGD